MAKASSYPLRFFPKGVFQKWEKGRCIVLVGPLKCYKNVRR